MIIKDGSYLLFFEVNDPHLTIILISLNKDLSIRRLRELNPPALFDDVETFNVFNFIFPSLFVFQLEFPNECTCSIAHDLGIVTWENTP